MSYDDIFFEVYYNIEKLGLRKEFDEQLELMKSQNHWKNKEFKEKYAYANEKVTQKYNKGK